MGIRDEDEDVDVGDEVEEEGEGEDGKGFVNFVLVVFGVEIVVVVVRS